MGGPFSLFEVVGIEIEYALVERESLQVLSVADAVLKRLAVILAVVVLVRWWWRR